MTKDEALKLALEALEKSHICPLLPDDCAEAITAIKEALEQPEHGWTPERIAGIARLKDAQDKKLAQRTWAGLTDEEVHDCLNGLPTQTIDVYARRIEAKLKEKNNG